jgi:hypothetical protein
VERDKGLLRYFTMSFAMRFMKCWMTLVMIVGMSQMLVKGEEEECHPIFTREIHQVCGSNGEIYLNPSIFKYNQCLLRKQGIEITLVGMDFCEKRHTL